MGLGTRRITIDIDFKGPNWPEHRLRPLVEKFVQMLIEQRVYREIIGVI